MTPSDTHTTRIPITPTAPGAHGAHGFASDVLRGTPYRAFARLGTGGMGEVFEAEHIALGTPVAVKLIRPELSQKPAYADRMRMEAQVLARLPHRNLVGVYDFGRTPDGRMYLVMERLRGRTLAEEIRARGALPVAEAVEYVLQALEGLSAAHQAGIVHRDVKLSNLFLCDYAGGRREVKVLDFGIVKILRDAGERAPAPLAYPTEKGIVLGTPRFLSPEQAAGRDVDARTDVYAMGAVLYAALTGRGPFDHAGTALGIIKAHASEEPEPLSMWAVEPLPEDLTRAVRKAMAKRPEARFPSASAFADELRRIADCMRDQRLAAPAAPPGGVKVPPLALFAVAALASALVCAALALALLGLLPWARRGAADDAGPCRARPAVAQVGYVAADDMAQARYGAADADAQVGYGAEDDEAQVSYVAEDDEAQAGYVAENENV